MPTEQTGVADLSRLKALLIPRIARIPGFRQASVRPKVRDIAAVRGIRMAVFTALCLVVVSMLKFPAPFLPPLFVSMLLMLPIPAPTLAGGLKFVVLMVISLGVGILLLPVLENQAGAAILIMVLGLFGSFYYVVHGGSPIVATFFTIGFSVIPVVGSESVDGAIQLSIAFVQALCIGLPFVWLGHALMPDPPPVDAPSAPAAAPPEAKPAAAARSAIRATLVVVPPLMVLLFTSGSAGYAAALIKIAQLGQQATGDVSAAASRSLMMSTVIGGIGGMAIWWVLKIWPALPIYGLLMLLAGLIFAPRIFRGAALAPDAATWSYGFTTLFIIVGPAVADSAGGDAVTAKFIDRIAMFMVATLWAVVAVIVFDRWLKPKR